MGDFLVTGAAALLFILTFLYGARVRPLRWAFRDDRSALSFGAGMSMAYVFVHLMPELHAARHSFAESVTVPLWYEGMAIYYVALVGFLVFFGLEALHGRKGDAAGRREPGAGYRLQAGGYAVYVWLMAYLLVHNLEEKRAATAFYAVPIALHFLALDYSLRTEHGAVYERGGRRLLAGMVLLGWVVGEVLPLPRPALALLVAFVSGAIIMNNTIMELPSDKDGRFTPFLLGGLIYGLMLIPLG